MSEALTSGVHHVGLAVPDVAAAERFFVEALNWRVVGGLPSYPAVFVSDGATMLTLWRVGDPEKAVAFDRRTNIGLHHLALRVADGDALAALFERVRLHPGVTVEFAPGPMREASRMHHFICAMPGGIRLEFATASS